MENMSDTLILYQSIILNAEGGQDWLKIFSPNELLDPHQPLESKQIIFWS